MAPAGVVKILNVIGHCHVQLNNSGPRFAAEKLSLHSSPERFDHGIVIAITDRAQAECESVVTHVASEGQGRKLRAMIGVMMISGVVGRDDAAMFRAEFTNAALACDGLTNPLLYVNMRVKIRKKRHANRHGAPRSLPP